MITNTSNNNLSGSSNKDGAKYKGHLDRLVELSMEKGAEDKAGTMAAGAEITILALIISFALYSVTLMIFPNNMVKYIREKEKEFDKTYYKDTLKDIDKHKKDLFSIAWDLFRVIVLASPFTVTAYYAYRKHRKAQNQRRMERLMAEEMEQLKKEVAKEANGGLKVAPDGKPTDKKLSGESLVELFNSFAGVMAFAGNLPRNEEETALEYFIKIAKHVRFPESESIKASRYFEDELYGKKNTTEEDRRAFLQLLLKMLDKTQPQTKIAA